MPTERIVKTSEPLGAVVREARSRGCIVQIDPATRQTVIRPHALPGMFRINQMFYGRAA